MLHLSQYTVDTLLYESHQSRVYRGKRLRDGMPVIFKLLTDPFPSQEKRARFQQEFDLMCKLESDAILRAHGLEEHHGLQVMILEDFGGTSLNDLNLAGTLSLREWLQLAARVAHCLGQLHQQHIMHKDINPANIVWNRQTGQIKLIDLGSATELTREMPEIRSPDRLEGTLAYMSPEQTGRMNRALDYRTDFYSLGVTFYKLLTGRLPFVTNDALEMVHAHMARMPVAIHTFRSDVPSMMSAIIFKLMGKMAEERYQSAAGLEFDLQTCLGTMDAEGGIGHFTLGQRDFSGRLHISQKLYGREEQIQILLDVFDRTSKGPAELLLVAGYSGVGKSALVHEIQKPICANRGFFIEGKFDQYKRDIPYAALSQAMKELIQKILTEGDADILQWKEKLLNALGSNAQIIIDVVPNLELIIGPQPPALAIPTSQEQSRFNYEFIKFVSMFATADQPLVIFLDDLQWADLPSLQVMSLLLRSPAMPHLMLIGAYRDNEITPVHPLSLTLKDMEQSGATVQTITLAPLDLKQVSRLLCDTFHADATHVLELAQLCLNKTQGNPFFLNQFLGQLVYRKIVRPHEGNWQWDIASVRQIDITDNIAELMVARLHQLPVATQNVLQSAACIGNVFDLKMLAIICELSEKETSQRLWIALQEELIVPLDANYKFVDQGSHGLEIALVPTYRFLHDRVQQAAYLLGNAEDKSLIHLRIGRLLLKSLSPTEQQVLRFELANHFNLGRSLITEPHERRKLAELNLAAGRRAKASTAYKPALVYLEVALEMVEESDWDNDHDMMLALHLEAAEASFLSLDVARMERYIQIVLPRAKDVLEHFKIQEIRFQALTALDKDEEVVKSGLDLLRMMGVAFPKKANMLHVLVSLMHTRMKLAGKKIEDLVHLPDATDARIIIIRKLLTRLCSPAYHAMPLYYPLFLLKAIRLSLQHGHAAPAAATDFANYGLLVVGVLGDMQQAARFGQLGQALQERPEMGLYKSRTMFMVHAGIDPWNKPLSQTLDPLTQGYIAGIEVGDLEFSGNSASLVVFHSFYCGRDLSDLKRDIENYLPGVFQSLPRMMLKGLRLAVIDLMGQSQPSEQELLEASLTVEHRSLSLRFQMLALKLFVCYQRREYRAALGHAERAEKYLSSAMSSVSAALFSFHRSLVLLALLGEASTFDRITMIRTIKRDAKKLRGWAKHAPENFLHKWHLIEAGLAAHRGHIVEANHHYENAMQLARQNNFPHEEAMSKELAGEYHLAQGLASMGYFYLREAQDGYRRWGALAKVAELAARYPKWLDEQVHSQPSRARTIDTITMTSTSTTKMLDLATVMKASQALSQEIVLASLLKRLMQVVMESAGAQRGILLLKKEKEWYLEAEKSQDDVEATVLQSSLLHGSHRDDTPLPLSLVRYVDHTKESIVIHEAAEEKLVANDPYVAQRHPRSLLIIPILHHGEMTGILYLENNAASGVFTDSRLEVLNLLASQAAISIENARLYADMEDRVAARTAELKAMSLRDGLTGVANRRAFDEKLQQELARSRRHGKSLSLLIIDIDHFKWVFRPIVTAHSGLS